MVNHFYKSQEGRYNVVILDYYKAEVNGLKNIY